MSKRKSFNTASNEGTLKIKVPKLSNSTGSFSSEKQSDKTSAEFDSKCWLQSLPNEVLELIYSFLSPRDLITVESLKSGRISDLIRKSRFADFSSCNDILPVELQQFISTDMTRHIREINFTHIFLVNTSELVKVIVRCKYLTSLTVIECGVTYDHIQRILLQCKLLKELCWNVLTVVGADNDMLELCELQIKKLYFHIDCPKSSEIGFYLLKKCPAVSEACFNFSSLLSPYFPLSSCKKNIVYKLHSYPVCPVDIILDDYFENLRSVYECITATKWCSCSNAVGSLHMPMTTPYLQIVATPAEYPSLALTPGQNVQTLVLYYSNKFFLREKVEDIKRVIGKSLTVLTMKEILSTEVDEEDNKLSASELIPNLISGCYNIQVLILSPVHFSKPLHLEALHCLTGLKTLGITSCALSNNGYRSFSYDTKTISPQQKIFEELVLNIKDVEHFSITKCECSCFGLGPNDNQLLAISKWNRLKTLSIVNVSTLQFYTFLRDIAVDCPNFRSLEIVNTSSQIVLHYIANVMILLTMSPQLMQLCINIDILCIKNKRFWESISSAKNLQSLCLTLRAPSSVYPKSIADAIEKLPLLHLFHFNSPNINEGLALRATRIMKRHGVKYPKVEMSTAPSLSNKMICDSPHIYTA